MHLIAVKYKQIVFLRGSLIKCQFILFLANFMKDDELIQYMLPYLFIFNIIYIRFNWDDLYQLKSFVEAFILTSISIETSSSLISADSRLRVILLAWNYANYFYMSLSFLGILLAAQYTFSLSQARMVEKIQSLEATIAKKDLYTAAMIHELRQPLNSVIGGVDLLCNSKCLSIDDRRNI